VINNLGLTAARLSSKTFLNVSGRRKRFFRYFRKYITFWEMLTLKCQKFQEEEILPQPTLNITTQKSKMDPGTWNH